MALSKYRSVLQERLELNDRRWEYQVPDLPRASDSDRAGYMKSCSLNANSTRQNIVLSYIKISLNRAISEQPINAFVHITCSDFRLHTREGPPATFRESSEYISRFLKNGLVLNGTRYSFYGHSNSQLKSRSCFLMMGSQDEVDSRVERLGDFSKMKTVAKKAKRIGLLFSTAHTVIDVDPSLCKDIADIEREDYIFTDGCGNIAPKLAKLLTQKKPILYRNKRYNPSVFQIRYRGYKGVVIWDPKLDSSTWLELRKSMRKFTGGNDHSFAVVEYSKPYTYGYLNDEIVLLLHALGITHEVFEQKQKEHLDSLDAAVKDPIYAFRFLTSIGSHDLAEKILLEGIETIQKQLQRMVAQEHGKMLNKRNEYRCRILIPKSRLLFGVCDHRGVLQEGECYVQPTADDNGIPHALTGSYVLVARNPCLHPGDLQKLRVVARPELAHLVDCIVFPTRGRRPAADMMSGGDLDGDTFFVCWDHDLIPSTIQEAAEYPGGKEPISFSTITSHDRIEYFAKSSSMQLGKVKNLFMKWARSKGPQSSQCQELNRLFSQCVDANRIKVPERLMNLPEEQSIPNFILDLLHDSAKKRIQTYSLPRMVESAPSEDSILAILNCSAGWSQFELAQLTLQWCQTHDARFEDFWQLFDHTQLSSEERAWFLAQIPAKPDIPETIMNDLMHSQILTPIELSSLGLRHSRIRWRCVYDSTTDRLANLLDTICRIFPLITRKLLVLRIHDRLSVAIYLSRIADSADEVSIERSGRLFAFPHTKGSMTNSRVTVPTKHNARLYYDHNTFQLYEGKKANTFVFLARAPNDDSKYRNTTGRGNRVRDREETIREGLNQEWWASIALNKFSQTLATHVGRVRQEGTSAAELYIISNTDTRSFRNLDLWLEQIDTDKVQRNFEHNLDEAFEMPSVANIAWQEETDAVVCIARDRDYRDLDRTSATDLARSLKLAWQYSLRDLTNDLYRHATERLRVAGSNSSEDVVSALMSFLELSPELVIWFVRLQPWSQLNPSISKQLMGYVQQLLVALVACANKVSRLAASSMTAILSECAELRIEELKRTVEMAALTTASPETTLDVLMEGLEPMTSRLLLLTPRNAQYLTKNLAAIAVDHVEEALDSAKSSSSLSYQWKFDHTLLQEHGNTYLKCDYRIDAPKNVRLAVGDHVKLVCVNTPSNIIVTEPVYFEALVEKSDTGQVTFRCLRYPPAFYQQSLWKLEHLGSFVTAQTMIDAVTKLMTEKQACCEIFSSLFPSQQQALSEVLKAKPVSDLSNLNDSQRNAVIEALTGPISCIWGPPGTGKTHTIVSIICEVLLSDKEKRLLVTAPTHNAVDNVMRKYLELAKEDKNIAPVDALRVSTDIRKVSSDLLSHTCDAMVGKDINQFPSARKKAQQRISQSRLVFTTCTGAGLGLLRNEHFNNVIIDEASQQTEPASLVPLVKGCSRAILVGDHVQLRTTVRPNAAALGFDVSLFERLWTESTPDNNKSAVRRVMLDTQYRMHPAICAFPSTEFYEGKLMTAGRCKTIAVPPSSFQWPTDGSRSVFIQVSAPEDLGRKSKSNSGQGSVCQEVIRQLRSHPATIDNAPPQQRPLSYSIAILTPYTRQAELLKRLLPDEKISSIDGFQGQEADVIVYVSVRCNAHSEIGFLKDMRRLNVALTRARAGTIIIGDESTLIGKMRVSDEGELEREEFYEIWKRLIQRCRKVDIELVSSNANTPAK